MRPDACNSSRAADTCGSKAAESCVCVCVCV
jgi:hypothetical protein